MSASLPAQRLYVGLIGPGLVGRELLRQMQSSSSSPSSFSLRVLFVATSKRMAFVHGSEDTDSSIDLETDWKAVLNAEGQEAEVRREALRNSVVEPTDLKAAVEKLLLPKNAGARRPGPAVLVDCSASSFAPEHVYGLALSRGISVVTPNKCFAAGPASVFEGALAGAVAAAAAAAPAAAAPPPPPVYLGEATVGAGLPVLSTLRDLVATGDRVKRIEGVFSGSLSFIFNTLFSSSDSDGGESGSGSGEESLTTLAAVVRRARDLGYTEPDPRDDLEGVDVARKAVILARALSRSLAPAPAAGAGGGGGGESAKSGDCPLPRKQQPLLLELSDVPVRSLVPPHLSDREQVDVEAFLTGLEADDGGVGAEVERARRGGEVLRYVGVVTVDEDEKVKNVVKAEVALRSFPRSHPYAGLSGADNVFSFVTERYSEASPLVVRGPGAGAAVTAAGVFGDLLTIARAAGASV